MTVGPEPACQTCHLPAGQCICLGHAPQPNPPESPERWHDPVYAGSFFVIHKNPAFSWGDEST